MKTYRYIQHDLDDLNLEMDSRAKNGWTILKAFEPKKYTDSDERYMGILWQKETTVSDQDIK